MAGWGKYQEAFRFRVSQELFDQFTGIAQSRGVSTSTLLRQVISNYTKRNVEK